MITIGKNNLSLENIESVAKGALVSLDESAIPKIQKARLLVEKKTLSKEPVYGVTTGFGALAEVKILPEQIVDLQRNLILSHAAGVGNPFSREETRAMMLLRTQTLSLGYSGVRLEVLELLIQMLNKKIHPIIPEKGSVGASGDLAPLAHLAMPMIGEGFVEYYDKNLPVLDVFKKENLKPLILQAKEGLALVNGTQTMASVGSLTLLKAEHLTRLADIAGAMTLEGLSGLQEAFDERIQNIRPHKGQSLCAENLRHLCSGSSTKDNSQATKVQDPYSLRCMPQVHGASRDALNYVRGVLSREVNSATDNPLVFSDDQEILSGGNFHGQPLALALDFAAIAISEIGNISERRVEQLVNPSLSGLPPFLVPESGIHSGYMIAQVTAASLVNENKVLATPASIDSIPGSASREDHVSMGMTSATKTS